MAYLIDKDRVIAEIERRIKYDEMVMNHDTQITELLSRELNTLYELSSFIKSLEVKEVDLDFQTFAKEMETVFALPSSKIKNTEEELLNWEYAIAKHFFELGLRSTITEEDCKLIWNIGDDLPYMSEEEFFKELLRRYKAQKGEEV